MTNKNGFSLVEIMLAIGLLGVLSTGIMKMFKLQTKSGKVMETQLEILQVYNSITQSLLNKEACSSTFSAVPQFENDAEVEFINNRAGNSIFNTTDIYGERTVKIEKMLIKDLAVESSGFGNFKLELHFKKQSKLLAGSKGLVVKTIPISAKVDSLNQLELYYSSTENDIDTAKKLACESIGGDLNSGGDKCDLRAPAAITIDG